MYWFLTRTIQSHYIQGVGIIDLSRLETDSLSSERSGDATSETKGWTEAPDDAENGGDHGSHDRTSQRRLLTVPDPDDQRSKSAHAAKHEDEVKSIVHRLICWRASKLSEQLVRILKQLGWDGFTSCHASGKTVPIFDD